MKTIDLIREVSNVVKAQLPLDYCFDFDRWLCDNESIISKLPEVISSNLRDHFPLREEHWKMIYKELYGERPYSKEYILQHYRKYKKSIPYVVYPTKKNKPKLLVSFSGFIDYESYSRLSWFWDRQENWNGEYVFLFLCDIDKHWYVGTPQNPKMDIYLSIIKEIIQQYDIELKDTYFVGSSMGGYASLLFGVILNVGGGNCGSSTVKL